MKHWVFSVLIFLYCFFSFQKFALAVPWGGFYVPIDQAVYNNLTGIIVGTGEPYYSQIAQILNTARSHNIKVIVTLRPVAECNYYMAADHTVFDYETALTDLKTGLNTVLQQFAGEPAGNKLEDYINDGTLAAIRVFDEVDYAGSCGDDYGIKTTINVCDYNAVLITREQSMLPIGTDSQPGFADLLHALKKLLPLNTVIGSTSNPGYMILVANRINILRQRENLPLLGNNSILAYTGYQCRENRTTVCPHNFAPAKDFYTCTGTQIPGINVIYFLANRSSAYESSNYIWWDDYMGICQATGVDFVSAWSWADGLNNTADGNFQARLADLTDNGVTENGQTIYFSDIQKACNPTVSPNPSSSPNTSSCQEDVNEDMVVNLADIMQILHLWNTSCTGCRADVNTDGIVNIGDIARILQQWGKVCN